MAKYAESTTVSAESSRTEIERTLSRYGAASFLYGYDARRAVIQFEAHGLRVRFVVPMPDPADPAFTRTPTGRVRATEPARLAWEQASRQRWRALALVIKAKLEAVESGLVEFDEEFAAHILLPDGTSVGQWLLPQIRTAYADNRMPPMLPSGPGD